MLHVEPWMLTNAMEAHQLPHHSHGEIATKRDMAAVRMKPHSISESRLVLSE
jgi:hypothetical protein